MVKKAKCDWATNLFAGCDASPKGFWSAFHHISGLFRLGVPTMVEEDLVALTDQRKVSTLGNEFQMNFSTKQYPSPITFAVSNPFIGCA